MNTKHSKLEKINKIKHKLRKSYNKAKEQRPRTILIPFIHSAYFIKKQYIENNNLKKIYVNYKTNTNFNNTM